MRVCRSWRGDLRRRRGVDDDQLRHRLPLFAAVELLFAILIFRSIADQEAIVYAGVEHRLDLS